MGFRDVDIKVSGLLKGERKTNKEPTRFQGCGCSECFKWEFIFHKCDMSRCLNFKSLGIKTMVGTLS